MPGGKNVKITLESSMYVGNDNGFYGGLEGTWGFGVESAKPLYAKPEDFIPKKHEILNGDQASLYLKKPKMRKAALEKKMQQQRKAGVYWTSSGPTYTTSKLMKVIKTGKQSEKVPPPKVKFRPDVYVVRDLPKVKLPPVPGVQAAAKTPPKNKIPLTKSMEGLADTSARNILPALVLGLVLISILRYNKS